jgi:two-component system, OmpR family, response regulator
MTALQNVLHVEDDESIIAISRLALETVGGLTVLSCTRGWQAIREAPGFQPDLILLDVMMPDMDGPTTLVELAKVLDLASRPVVFMTAKTQPGEYQAYLDMGASDVIIKPFDPLTLAEQLKAIWIRFNEERH